MMAVAEALAFDMYGTLVDPIRIWKQLERYFPGDAQRIAEIWRQKQLEFTFRLTAMERYEDFEQVTRKALDYALAAAGHSLDAQHKNSLMARPANEVRLVSSNPFDVIGAESAGMQAAWVNRSGGLFDTLAPRPHMVVKSLVELADVLVPL